MLRIILVVVFIVLFLIISLPVQLILWLISKKWPGASDKISYPMVNFCFRGILFFSGVKLTVIGRERIPSDTPVLYAGNHRSLFDIVVTYPLIVRPTGYLAKIELKKIPGLNTWMSLMHCIFLDRKDIRQGLQSILDCIELIKRGISVTVFPEGTRNKVNDTFLPFHDASFKVALKAGCPIIPIAINNTADIFEEHLPKIKATHVVVEYLEPIYPSELSPENKKQIGAYVQQQIKDAYFKNRELTA